MISGSSNILFDSRIIQHFIWLTTASYVMNSWSCLGKTHKYGWVKRCMRAKPSPLDNWTQSGNTYICTDSLLFNKPYTIKKNKQ
jgi:hypothetical protein